MSLIDDVTQYYEARALVYDETAGYTNADAERLRTPIKTRFREVFAGHDVLEIACGTGYWTPTLGEVARSVLAVDINPSPMALARDRCKHLPNVRFQISDAYSLEGVPVGFTAAFAHWWWSHVPVDRLPAFLAALHSKLLPEAVVLFVDELLYGGRVRRTTDDGNILEQRSLPDGRSFEIVKNFPTEEEVRNAVAGIADNVQYVQRADEGSWSLTYTVAKCSPAVGGTRRPES